ncbi:hypothetical protein D3C81_1431050 [compost metagenome]
MTGSYIPACWASFKRSQEAQEKNRSLVTDLELEWIEDALKNITDQLRSTRRHFSNQTLKYQETHQADINAFMLESDKVSSTLARLKTLRYERVTEQKVYGSLTTQPEQLAENLQRWLAHAENQVIEQLAMAPANGNHDELLASIYGHAIGAPYNLDIDSLI